MTEKEIQNQILRTFATRGDMRLFRSATGYAVPFNEIKKVVAQQCPDRAAAIIARLHPIHFGTTGQADLNGVLGHGFGRNAGKRLEIEVKQWDGKLSEAQTNWGNTMTRMGAIYVVARCVDDVAAALDPLAKGET